MKIRNNYVSNSSSSSFVVQAKLNSKAIISLAEIDLLRDFGFRFIAGEARDNVFNTRFEYISKENEYPDKCLAMDVVCNQEDVIDFLLKNRISFIGSIHNDEYLYIYDNKNEYYEIYVNYGIKRIFNYPYEDFEEDLIPYRRKYFLKKDQEEIPSEYLKLKMLKENEMKLNERIKEHFSKDELDKIGKFFKDYWKGV